MADPNDPAGSPGNDDAKALLSKSEGKRKTSLDNGADILKKAMDEIQRLRAAIGGNPIPVVAGGGDNDELLRQIEELKEVITEYCDEAETDYDGFDIFVAQCQKQLDAGNPGNDPEAGN